jgi:glycosidase
MVRIALGAVALISVLGACASGPSSASDADPEARGSSAEDAQSSYSHVDWSKNAVIYELNTRQFTDAGTFAAAAGHLDRLARMGVDIIWLMPIHPIGDEKRKGELGSPYSVADYRAVNPEFGTMEDFRAFLDAAHDRGMRVILDWVANHSAWDHPWVSAHPDWYTKNAAGEIVHPPGTDWTDVADFNYDNEELRRAMIDAMRFWVEEIGVDGFRADVAHDVPADFWVRAITELREIKPLFMLAEAESPSLHLAGFDMTYGWKLHHLMNDIASGRRPASAISRHYERLQRQYREQDIVMNFTSNHDENSWNGHVFERLGEGAKAFAVLSFTLPGMPLIYNGQEAALDQRLAFFRRDPIDWGNYALEDFYTALAELKERSPALWHGRAGGTLEVLEHEKPREVFAFLRGDEEAQVLVVVNLSDETRSVQLSNAAITGEYRRLFRSDSVRLDGEISVELEPWGYCVFERPGD